LGGDFADGRFPLVAISHGGGGSHLLYRNLAAHLARNGFVVICPEHPGNNRNNNELANTDRLLAERPRQLRLAIDYLSKENIFVDLLRSDVVAIIGHSIGGYTAFACAGARPTPFPHEKTEIAGDNPLTDSFLAYSFKDDRVKALVLLAPATGWFRKPNALDEVQVPILILTGERDEITPPFHAEILEKGLPDTTFLEHHVVPNAGHFSFLAPFPESRVSPQFAPSQDPPGFDRPAFHRQLNPQILRFLRQYC
jgi:predicted dienelactone hydrolase